MQCRVAIGEQSGARVERLGRRRDARPLFLPGELCCDLDGFSLFGARGASRPARSWPSGPGDFANSFVLAKMKLLTRGRLLWTRTIGSTLVAQGVDSLIFYPIAFAGIWEAATLAKVVLFNWSFKVAVEALFTPVTYWVIHHFKRIEDEDYYDRGTNFTPSSLED